MCVTLTAIEELWQGEKPSERQSILNGLAGYLHAGTVCRWCRNRHRTVWISAVHCENDVDVLHEWLVAGTGTKAEILRQNIRLEPILRAHLEARLSVLTSRPRPPGGMACELFDLYAAGPGSEDRAYDTDWQQIRVALVDATLPGGPGGHPVVAGFLEFQPVADAGAGVYPVCCQTFVMGDADFMRSFEAAAEILEELWSRPDAPQRGTALRWRIRTYDHRPISKVDGGSLDLACELTVRNIYLRVSANGCVSYGKAAEFCEVAFDPVGASARVIRGTIDPVSAVTISDKLDALLEAGAECVLVAAKQLGLPGRRQKVIRRGSVPRTWNSVFVRQSETVLEMMASRRLAACYVFGNQSLMWTVTLWTTALWITFVGYWFFTPGVLLAVAVFCLPPICSRQRSPKVLLLDGSETRTPLVWGKMAAAVARRLRLACARNQGLKSLAPLAVSSMAVWISEMLKASHQERSARLPAQELFGRTRRAAWRRGDFFATSALLIVLLLLISPLQCQVAEWLPPWDVPGIRGGWASRLESDGIIHWAPFEPGTGQSCSAFMAIVGPQGEIVVTTDDKLRTARWLRVECKNCTVLNPAGYPPTLSPVTEPIRVVHGKTAFSYFVVATAKASLSIELLDTLGHHLACAAVGFSRE